MKLILNIKTKVTLWYLALMAAALCLLSAASYVALSRSAQAGIASLFTFAYATAVCPGLGASENGIEFQQLGSYTLSKDKLVEILNSETSPITVQSPGGPFNTTRKN